ncbi:MAG: uracil-DNA glycosylase [Phycisphaerae bacterium]|nr:uracil-DNA glycosylase [Phycisphaerae bacterium]
MDPSSSHFKAAVAQSARTSQLLGVDFIPVFRAPAKGGSADAPGSGGPLADAPSAASAGARNRDAAQAELDRIRARYEAESPHKQFCTSFNKIVFGEGDPCARLMFVGEAPGAEEDLTGRPFVGRAGQLLDQMIAAMGLRRQDVYIANVLKTRPPNNATPTIEEAELCAPFLFAQIEAVAPEVLVTLGLPATRLLLKSDRSMGDMRGRWASFSTGRFTCAVMPTYHPAFLLRSYTPENRKKVWSDLKLAMERLGLRPQAAHS